MKNNNFNEFLSNNPHCRRLYEVLSAKDTLLAQSFETVFEMHGTRLKQHAYDILSFLEQSDYRANYAERFIERVSYLNTLQETFNKYPTTENLHGPKAEVDRADYNIALLMSILISNHRMEIMQSLSEFISFIKKPQGRLASVGMGTGFELKLVHDILPGWSIEGYDNDEKAHEDAKKLLTYFNVVDKIRFGGLFPDDRPADAPEYDAILLCELLEHLEDPEGFLKTVKPCLKPDGFMFVTMAINIAQEDHIYLYTSVDDCRKQLSACGLTPLLEKIMPMTIRPISPSENREKIFQRGNYMAVVR